MMSEQKTYFLSSQALEHKTLVPIFTCAHSCLLPFCPLTPRRAHSHRDVWWTRLSAQVYNDLDDFKYVAGVVKHVCEKINKGEYQTEVELHAGSRRPVKSGGAVAEVKRPGAQA